MKRIALVALVLGLLAIFLPASAGAKGLRSAVICGASGCHTANPRDATHGPAERALVEGGGPIVASPSHAGPWYRVRATVGGDGAHAVLRLAIVPSLDLIRASDEPSGSFNWISMTAAGERAYARLTRGLDPFPASTLRGIASSDVNKASSRRSPGDPPLPSSAGVGAADSDGMLPIWAWTLIGAGFLGVGTAAWRRRSRTERQDRG
jgi:hypothetical protein